MNPAGAKREAVLRHRAKVYSLLHVLLRARFVISGRRHSRRKLGAQHDDESRQSLPTLAHLPLRHCRFRHNEERQRNVNKSDQVP
ncbi:hypothetical protein J6590_042978 [Homalodisca vitripennis]|nr:hypothetical protein J6590_042978 [Homalodisca vitripennis]